MVIKVTWTQSQFHCRHSCCYLLLCLLSLHPCCETVHEQLLWSCQYLGLSGDLVKVFCCELPAVLHLVWPLPLVLVPFRYIKPRKNNYLNHKIYTLQLISYWYMSEAVVWKPLDQPDTTPILWYKDYGLCLHFTWISDFKRCYL